MLALASPGKVTTPQDHDSVLSTIQGLRHFDEQSGHLINSLCLSLDCALLAVRVSWWQYPEVRVRGFGFDPANVDFIRAMIRDT